MRHLYAIAAREVVERRMLFATATACGFIPLQSAFFGLPGHDGRMVLAVATVDALLLGAAVLCGASVVGRDLAEDRLGFYFARPVSWWSIWGGKMAAAVLLSVGTALCAALPATLVEGFGGPLWRLGADRVTLAALLIVLLLVGLGHAASVAYRSRSPWLALDLVLILAVGAGGTRLVASLWHLGVLGGGAPLAALDTGVLILASAVVACLWTAGAMQVRFGRTDPRRGHAALSVALWGSTGVVLAGLWGYEVWVVAAGPSDLAAIHVAQAAPAGTWTIIAGPARHRGGFAPVLLYDTASGRYVRAGAFAEPVLSADGRRAAWFDAGLPPRRPARLRTATLDAAGAVADFALPDLEDPPRAFALSPSGARLATASPTTLTVWDLASPRVLASTPIPAGDQILQVAFVSEDAVRAFRRHEPVGRPADATLDLVEVDVPRAAAAVSLRIPTRGNAWVRMSPDTARLLVLDRIDHGVGVTLRDTKSGAAIATLVEPGTASGVNADFLSDGRIVVLENAREPRLRSFAPDGREERVVALGSVSIACDAGEIGPGEIAVSTWGASGALDTLIVDLAAGRVVRRETGLVPVESRRRLVGDPRARRAPTPDAPSLWWSRDRLVRIDPRTGVRTVVLTAG